VHVVPADGLTDVGLQEKPFKLGVCTIVTVPLLVEVESAVAVVLADIPLVSWTTEEVLLVDADKVKLTVATTPVVIGVSLRPHSIQIAVPVPYWQESDLVAAAVPAVTISGGKVSRGVTEIPLSRYRQGPRATERDIQRYDSTRRARRRRESQRGVLR
jgi:hypothetical protein